MSKQATQQMFREEALEKLSSPEQVDQLLEVVTRKSWIPILTLALGVLAALAWSILGRIPVSVEGRGLLVYPQQVRAFQAPASGQIVSLDVNVGDEVRANQLLGRINQSELQQRLDHEQISLAEMKARDREVLKLHTQRMELEKKSIDRTRQRLEDRIATTTQLAEARKAKNEKYFAKQTENLGQLRNVMNKLGISIEERFERFRKLFTQGMAKQQEVFDAQRESISHNVQLADLELRMHEIELKRIEAEGDYVRQTDLVADLEAELHELDILTSKIDLLQLETVSNSKLRIQELERSIDRIQNQLDTKGDILSEYTGRIVEVTAAVGQFIGMGKRLGSVAVEKTEQDLIALVYYDVSDGKRIEVDMDALISPSTVQRARFGSMIGTVIEVSSFPVTTESVTNIVGNAEVAQRLTAGANKIEVRCTLKSDPDSHSGFQWTSGKGPGRAAADITTGTTVKVYTTIEYRQPISYVIPLLRQWSGS